MLTADELARMVRGLGLTWGLWGFALPLAILGGLMVAFARLSPWSVLRAAARGFVDFFRGVPVLVVVMLCYFGLPDIGIVFPKFIAGAFGLALCYSAFIGETFRAGIEAVDRGQTEAARALGLRAGQTMRFVVLPQAIRNVLPVLGNESIALFKDTSLVMVTGLIELLNQAKLIAGGKAGAFRMYMWAALFYLVSTLLLGIVQRRIERSTGGGSTDPRPRSA